MQLFYVFTPYIHLHYTRKKRWLSLRVCLLCLIFICVCVHLTVTGFCPNWFPLIFITGSFWGQSCMQLNAGWSFICAVINPPSPPLLYFLCYQIMFSCYHYLPFSSELQRENQLKTCRKTCLFFCHWHTIMVIQNSDLRSMQVVEHHGRVDYN